MRDLQIYGKNYKTTRSGQSMEEDTSNETVSIQSFTSLTKFVNMSSTALPPFNDTGGFSNETVTQSDSPLLSVDQQYGLSTKVTVAIALGSAIVVIIITIVIVCFVWKKYKARKKKSWVDNLTLSYIADSNIDLTKDSCDEMISLDNDNFLNSLDTHSFSVFSASGSTNAARQYTYSYF